MPFEADFFDGKQAHATRVYVSLDPKELIFRPVGKISDPALIAKQFRYPTHACEIQPPLGNSKRIIDLPDGGRLETPFKDIEASVRPSNRWFWRAVHFAETHRTLIMIAIIGIVAISAVLFRYGIPGLAYYVASLTPASTEYRLGQQTMETLDHASLGYFQPSRLPESEKQTIKQALNKVCGQINDCPQFHLIFRKSTTIGANAFALPGGIIVITDGLVHLAKNQQELLAVLLHELGHIKQRHALRQTLQGTLSGLLIIAITGDISNLAAGLPAMMLNLRYSRAFENEADMYALSALQRACIPPQAFASILLRLEQQNKGAISPEILSSHPDTRRRIAPFESIANCHEPPHNEH